MNEPQRADQTGPHALQAGMPARDVDAASWVRPIAVSLLASLVVGVASFWSSTEVGAARSDQRLGTIERRLDALEERFGAVDAMSGDVRELRVGFEAWRQRDQERSAEIERRLGRIEAAIDGRRYR